MKDLARIEATRVKLDLARERELSTMIPTEKAKVISQQIIDDQADFILAWGQLENETSDRCRAAVDRRRNDPDWQVRRAWDLTNPNEPRFSGPSFENRARLVLDRQGGRGSPCALTIEHYGSRNLIAHGDLRSTRVDVSAFVADGHPIRSALQGAA